MVLTPVREVLKEVALKYPHPLVENQLQDIARTAFHIGLVRRSAGRDCALCEIGGVGGLFAPGCAALGMQVTLVDQPADRTDQLQKLVRHFGVDLRLANLMHGEIEFPPNQFDAVVSLHAIRHLHTAPERFFVRLKSWLRPGGVFILGVANGARSRSREPQVADLKNLAKHMELRRVRVIGRNWVRSKRSPLGRAADHLLRLSPALCSDLYLIGYK